jgi:Ni,Fe-hydrogenase III large subunit
MIRKTPSVTGRHDRPGCFQSAWLFSSAVSFFRNREQQGRTGRLSHQRWQRVSLAWRAKLRGPSFVNLQVLPEFLRGYKMSDVIAILGSLDFVVGEVDR